MAAPSKRPRAAAHAAGPSGSSSAPHATPNEALCLLLEIRALAQAMDARQARMEAQLEQLHKRVARVEREGSRCASGAFGSAAERDVVVHPRELLLSDLPLDALVLVAQHLAPDDELAVSLTCRKLRVAVASSERHAQRDAAAHVQLRTRPSSVLGSLRKLQWAAASGLPLGTSLCAASAKRGLLEQLSWLRASGCDLGLQTSKAAADGGHLTVLRWARANGCEWDGDTCATAAQGGHLTVLQWARANGCAWDVGTSWFAAEGGHLGLLQWARANGCQWDAMTCSSAAEGGHLGVLQWARANGCAWDADTCSYAAHNGHLTVLQWARANGCPEE